MDRLPKFFRYAAPLARASRVRGAPLLIPLRNLYCSHLKSLVLVFSRRESFARAHPTPLCTPDIQNTNMAERGYLTLWCEVTFGLL